MVREHWLNLNGLWQFEADPGDSGIDRGLRTRDLADLILVPFAPESKASGIGTTDFLHAVWYRTTVDIPGEWDGREVILHFGAVDHDATVWANNVEVVRHRGGYTSFSANLTSVVTAGDEVSIVVRARDPKVGPQARGKQSVAYRSEGCNYTRTTGIWQTVWLEAVPKISIGLPRITPALAGRSLNVRVPLSANREGDTLRVMVWDGPLIDRDGTPGAAPDSVAIAIENVVAHLDLMPTVRVVVPESKLRPWCPEDPHLYPITIELIDASGYIVDKVSCYAGMRSIAIDRQMVRLNGRPVFQRLVLDQGYYPDTLMTAPDDDALVRDIRLGLAAGFNGARLHQKVFEERFLYHADRLGYLVWAEFGDWGSGGYGEPDDSQQPTASFITQWMEAVERDYNHPSIVGWCPLNESQQVITDNIRQLDDVTRGLYLATKLADPTRPVLDASGYSHRVLGADIYDSHNYEQDPNKFTEQMHGLDRGIGFTNINDDGRSISVPYRGQPYFCSEFGGIWWNPDVFQDTDASESERDSWGYGPRARDEEGLQRRFEGLVDVLMSNPRMFGYCYTQLTDVFQEQNGIYRFDRTHKLDVERIREVQQRPAAIETISTE